MKSQTQNPLVLPLTALAAVLFVCGAVTIAAAEEDFPTLLKRLQQGKPAVRQTPSGVACGAL